MTALLLTLLATFAAGQQWLGFRGNNGSGVAETTGLPTEFGPGKRSLWKTAVPFGRSSPVLSGDRVFLTAAEGDELITLALDQKTGKVLWRQSVRRAREMPIYRANDAASPTPASDGTNVYAFFAELGLISYTADGKERWRVPLGPFRSFYGMGGSPVVSGNTLILVCDQRTNSFVIAVDTKTGKVRWRKDRTNPVEGFTTPVVYTPSRGPVQVIILGSAMLDAYALDTGDRLWWVRQVGSYPKGVPALGSGMVYVSAAGSDQPTFPAWEETLQKSDLNKDGVIQLEEAKQTAPPDAADHWGWVDDDGDGVVNRQEYELIRNSGALGHGLTAIRLDGPAGDATAARVAWRVQKQYPNVPAPLLYNDVLYTVRTGGIVMSLDPKTGEVFKTGRLEKALEDYFSSPVAADGKVYMVSETGKMSVLRAGPQWEVLAVNDLGEECWATPAIGDGTIFVRTRSALYAFGGGSGS